MGRQFYDGTMPRLVKVLERIADRLDHPRDALFDSGEYCTFCGLLQSYHNGTDCDGAKAASDENNDPQAYDNRAVAPDRPLEDTSRDDLDRMGQLLKRATDAEQKVRELENGLALSRKELKLGKYTSGYDKLTSDQFQGLLWLLGEWSCRAQEDGTLTANKGRAYAARKALMEFTRNPLTLDEVRALMRKAAG
jgi:hypothetical protein